MRILRTFGRGLGISLVAIGALAFVGTVIALATNYTVTQGAGTTFGSIVVSGTNYAQQLICDPTTPTQCAAVSAGGAVKVDASATTQPVSAAALPLPTGAATSANQSTEITSLATIATNTGASVPAGTALIGKVGIDQTTPGTTNGVQVNAALPAGTNVIGALSANQSVNTAQVNGVAVLTGTGATGTGAQRVTVSTDQATNAGAALVKGGVGVVSGGSTYQAVAASQTATVLQTSTGAIGDYLSHCTIYPTSTSPGVVTVFDNTNAAATSAILFPGGASSLSNLVPFTVPVGAVSVSGAWKVTTGTAVSVVCYGKFS